MNPLINSYVLPLLGAGIIVFCVFSFLLPYGSKFQGKIQHIKGFGVELEVSILTLFVIVGLILSSTGLYLQLKDYNALLDSYKVEVNSMRTAMERGQKFRMTLVLNLGDLQDSEMPKLDDVECEIHIIGIDQPVRVQVNKGILSQQFRITVPDVTTGTYIRRLVLRDRSSNRVWSYDDLISPLEPSYDLARGG